MDARAMEKLRAVFCVLFRHSNILECFFGYISCARCGYQVGDTIAGCYRNELMVGLDCPCKSCEANLSKLTWKDTFLSPSIPWRADPEAARIKQAEDKKKWRATVDELLYKREAGR